MNLSPRFSLSVGFCLLLGLGTAATAASLSPTTSELTRFRLFPEALSPVGGEPSAAENAALSAALRGLVPGARLTALDAFIEQQPQSPWLPSLLLNRGLRRFDEGFFSAALADWTRAWALGRQTAASPEGEALVTRALAEAVKMYCRVGRVAEAKALLTEFGERPAFGLNASLLDQARKAIGQMETLPDDCFKCGPFALSSILSHQRTHTRQTYDCVTRYPTTAQGTSLAQVAELANGSLGMKMQPVRRATGQAAPPLPAVVHWKLDHYGALLEHKDGRYLLVDPTFGTSQWILAEALEQEASGYFLVPAGALPAGYAAVSAAEAGKIWGRGNCANGDGNGTGKNDPKKPDCPKPPGMADWSVHTALASLNLEDTPLSYSPPVGPEVAFRLNYSQLEQNQPTTINFSNVGPLWNLEWVSSLTFDSNNALARMGGGGTELFTRFNGGTQSYDPEQASGAVLVRLSASLYERRATDGSKLVFGLPDGSGRIFLTQQVDPQGNALTFGYDANFRLVTVADAIGQITTIEHGSNTPGNPLFYRVTKVTDPFGRFTTLAYNASQQLTSLTDTVGIVSQFTYDANGKVNSLITPYGTTSFVFGSSNVAPAGVVAFVEVTEPNGAKQRVETIQTSIIPQFETVVPAGMPTINNYMQWRNSFYWDRKAMAEAPGDYTKAEISHFQHLNVSAIKANVLESTKSPLENRVWYAYPGQTDPIFTSEGMGANPSHIGRVLDDGSTQLYRYTYNAQGNVTLAVDPLGRTIKYAYAANGIDLLTVKQVNASGGDDLLATYTWNAQHRPVSITDTAGGVTTYSYNARGQVLTMTNAAGETTTYGYNVTGHLLTIDGPLPGSGDQLTFSYDAVGRVRTVTDGDSYVVTADYDALDRLVKVSYPDGTFEETTYTNLDATQTRDRTGRLSAFTYNAVRQPTSMTDPLNRVTTLDWCTCGSLRSLTDPLHRMTVWAQDIQGRVTSKTYPNGSQESYTYERTSSRLATATDARGQTKGYFYHLDDTISDIVYGGAPQSTPSVSFTYDKFYSRLTAMRDGTGLTTFAYHPISGGVAPGANRLAEVHTSRTAARVTYGYDSLGRIASRAIDGVAQTYIHDARGRLIGNVHALGSFSYTYEGGSERLSSVTVPNGQSVAATYFGNAGDRRLQQLKNARPDTSVLSQFDHTYDAAGRLLGWNQQASGVPANNYSLGYDAVDQLTAATAPGRSFGYTYDSAGNLRTRTFNAVVTSLSYNVLNELQSASPALPANADKTYLWDADNRLVGIDYTGTSLNTRLVYDGAGRCVEITENNGGVPVSVRRFVWCGEERCEERDASGNVTKRFFGQGEQVNGVAYFYTFDHLGSVREMTDQSGVLRARYDYDPYGLRTKVSGDLDASVSYTGHYYHAPSGLHLTLFRAYDAATGRWLSRDPLGEEADTNCYAYVRNNPVSLVDPLGLIDSGRAAKEAALTVGSVGAFFGGGALIGLGAGATVGAPVIGPLTGPQVAAAGSFVMNTGLWGTFAHTGNFLAALQDQPSPFIGSPLLDVGLPVARALRPTADRLGEGAFGADWGGRGTPAPTPAAPKDGLFRVPIPGNAAFVHEPLFPPGPFKGRLGAPAKKPAGGGKKGGKPPAKKPVPPPAKGPAKCPR